MLFFYIGIFKLLFVPLCALFFFEYGKSYGILNFSNPSCPTPLPKMENPLPSPQNGKSKYDNIHVIIFQYQNIALNFSRKIFVSTQKSLPKEAQRITGDAAETFPAPQNYNLFQRC